MRGRVSASDERRTCSIVDQWQGNSACGLKLTDASLDVACWDENGWQAQLLGRRFCHGGCWRMRHALRSSSHATTAGVRTARGCLSCRLLLTTRRTIIETVGCHDGAGKCAGRPPVDGDDDAHLPLLRAAEDAHHQRHSCRRVRLSDRRRARKSLHLPPALHFYAVALAANRPPSISPSR